MATEKQNDKKYIVLDFRPDSPNLVTMTPTYAGIIPDRGALQTEEALGIFADEMPQNIITRVVNYGLKVIVLMGNESPTLIRNLRATIVPDIRKELQIWKNIDPNEDEAERSKYEGCVDKLLTGGCDEISNF